MLCVGPDCSAIGTLLLVDVISQWRQISFGKPSPQFEKAHAAHRLITYVIIQAVPLTWFYLFAMSMNVLLLHFCLEPCSLMHPNVTCPNCAASESV